MLELKKEDFLELGRKLNEGMSSDEATITNLLSFVDLKEYRHSAILGYLLGHPIANHGLLGSFLSRIIHADVVERMMDDPNRIEVTCERMVTVNGTRRPIDILCTFANGDEKWALIIENKCRDAKDQTAQIRDYWAGICAEGYAPANVYVLYLSSLDSVSGPSVESLGDLKDLISGELKNHLIVSSYRQLILPWLKDEVLLSMTQFCNRSPGKASLLAYIDMLDQAYGNGEDVERVVLVDRLHEIMGTKGVNSEEADERLYAKTKELLERLNTIVVPKDAPCSESEKGILSLLRNQLWKVRSLLFERNVLLDEDQLAYEIQWLIAGNPTTFGRKYRESKLDTGKVFTGRGHNTRDVNGRWVWWTGKDKDGKYVECDLNCTKLVAYLKSSNSDPKVVHTWRATGISHDEELPLEGELDALSMGATRSVQHGGEMLFVLARAFAAELKCFGEHVG